MSDKNIEQQLQELETEGFYYEGHKKNYVGKIQLPEDGSWTGKANVIGYFRNTDGTYDVFITDSERGLAEKNIECISEEDAIEKMLEFVRKINHINLCKSVLRNYSKKEPLIMTYLNQEYGYSVEKAWKVIGYLKQVEYIAFEFVYYVERREFVPDQYATLFSGYTAKRLNKEKNMTILDAFVYMVYLKKNPVEALENLKKDTPCREFINETKPKEVHSSMEGAEVIRSEIGEQAAQTGWNENSVQPELLPRMEILRQEMAKLQQSFDDKIAEDAHKNALFDEMHRELVRYQNGIMDKIVDTLALDIIQLVDSTKGYIDVYKKEEPTAENYKRLLRIVTGIAEDLEDILYRQSIEPYCVEGCEVDVRKQKIIQTVETDDPSLNNQVADRLVSGYEREGKVIRPERIKVFKYNQKDHTMHNDNE